MSREKNDVKRVNIRVSDDIHAFFMARSARTGASMSSLMAIALEEYMEQKEVVHQLPELMKKLERLESEVKK